MALKRVCHALENQDNYRAMPDAAGGTRERVLCFLGGFSEDGNALHEDHPRLLAQFAATRRCAASYLEVAQFYNSSFAMRIEDSAENALLVTADPKWATRTSVLTETVIHLSPKMTAHPPS